MLNLPSSQDAFEHENAFYLSCQPVRIGKFLAQLECFRKTLMVPGEIVECGVFKGASFARWAMLRDLLGHWARQQEIQEKGFGIPMSWYCNWVSPSRVRGFAVTPEIR